MWRAAVPEDDEAIVEMSLGLYEEDPSDYPIDASQIRRTLSTLRAEPWRGRPVVLEVGGQAAGYALLISFWSNELGGEVCDIDEVYLRAPYRGRGHGSLLFDLLERAELWPAPPAALTLLVSPTNGRARALYERLGFRGRNLSMIRRR